MLPYWLFFLIPAGVILANQRLTEKSKLYVWGLVWLLFALFIGLRFEVGADWFTYKRLLEMYTAKSFWDVITGETPVITCSTGS